MAINIYKNNNTFQLPSQTNKPDVPSICHYIDGTTYYTPIIPESSNTYESDSSKYGYSNNFPSINTSINGTVYHACNLLSIKRDAFSNNTASGCSYTTTSNSYEYYVNKYTYNIKFVMYSNIDCPYKVSLKTITTANIWSISLENNNSNFTIPKGDYSIISFNVSVLGAPVTGKFPFEFDVIISNSYTGQTFNVLVSDFKESATSIYIGSSGGGG